MRKTTKGHGLLGGTLTALATAVLALLFAGGLLAAYFGYGGSGAFAAGFTAVYVLLFLAVAAGVTAALVQRWREVKSGEEEAAKKY